MTNRPMCPKGQRKPGSPCIFCQDGAYCAHQYYCPETRKYENTGWRECRRMKERNAPLSQATPDSSPTRGEPGNVSPFMGEVAATQAADGVGGSRENDPPKAAGPTSEQEVNKEVKSAPESKEEVKKEVKSSGEKKTTRRKPRKG